MLDQRFSIIIESLWKMKLPLQDVLIDHKRIIISKWVNTSNHFIDQNTQGPPVYWLSMTLILQDLGR
jgi:hypothetical protein